MLDHLGDPAHGGGDNREPECERLHDGDSETFAE
jgi:hypothetical protein